MKMFQYALAGQSETVQRAYEQELRRLVEWAWQHDCGMPVPDAAEAVEEAICQCRPLSWQEYHRVCGAAALLAYVAREADGGFGRLRAFFQGVPDLFAIEWSCAREPVSEGAGYGWE